MSQSRCMANETMPFHARLYSVTSLRPVLAILLLTTDCIIAEAPKKKDEGPGGDHHGMGGGMGGMGGMDDMM